MKKATAISQIVLFPKPLRVWLMVSAPEIAVAAIPNNAIAPIGNGFVMMPTIVATKIANICHARGWTPDGGGINQMMTAWLFGSCVIPHASWAPAVNLSSPASFLTPT